MKEKRKQKETRRKRRKEYQKERIEVRIEGKGSRRKEGRERKIPKNKKENI